jgi:hypothetical protein
VGAKSRNFLFASVQLAPFSERISYGLGQRYHYVDEITHDLGKIIIILMQSGYCSENSPTFQTTLRGPSDCGVVSNNNEQGNMQLRNA